MCWCWPFSNPKPQKRKGSSAADRKRREKLAQDALHGSGVPVAADVQEKRRSRESDHRRRSKEKVTTRDPRREKAQQQQQQQQQQYQYQYQNQTQYQYQYPAQHQYQYQQSPRYDQRYYRDYQRRAAYRPNLNLEVPNMWHRAVDTQSSNSSQEMLLNPRPHRSHGQHRQRHPKRTSSSTLRGRGAKRDPPRHSKSKKSLKQDSTRQTSAWSWFAASPPKTPSRRTNTAYNTSPRTHRSPRTQQYQQIPEQSSSNSHQRSPRHHRSRQTQSSSNRAHTPNPNTAARRTPDRRFAVLAATNAALEDVRREAFSQPSPPPRRERRQRYQGVNIPTSSIPFNWDCVSSSQTSASTPAVAGPSVRQRRSRRY